MGKKWYVEGLSWVFVLVFGVLILAPIYMKVGENYSFYLRNFISIALMLTIVRWLFLLSFTPFSRNKWVKFALVFLPIPLFLFQIDSLYDFQRLLDEEGVVSFFKDSSSMDDYQFGKFIKYQYLFFCIGALVSIAFLPIRMIISFWRTTNTPDRV